MFLPKLMVKYKTYGVHVWETNKLKIVFFNPAQKNAAGK